MSKKNNTVAIIFFALVGLVIGYLIFAKTNSGWISIPDLCFPAKGLKKVASKLGDMGTIRLEILGCGAAGVVLGYLFGKINKK
ncbi:MAG: hypothetical protein IKZ57_07410 [Spirochaetia bacterium]|nr:hypothetical protein [Spirochaetia bacterium]